MKFNINEFPITPGVKPGTFVTCASDLELKPGDFPKVLEISGQYFSRFVLNAECAEYVGATQVLTVFND